MYPNRYAEFIIAGVLAIISVALIAIIMTVGSQWDLDRAGRRAIATVVVRNEWGQLKHTPEFMCEATIRQWLDACGG